MQMLILIEQGIEFVWKGKKGKEEGKGIRKGSKIRVKF